jgi:phage gp37-like protein
MRKEFPAVICVKTEVPKLVVCLCRSDFESDVTLGPSFRMWKAQALGLHVSRVIQPRTFGTWHFTTIRFDSDAIDFSQRGPGTCPG